MLDRVAKIIGRFRFKMLTPKHILQLLPIVLAQVKTGDTSQNLLNVICQIKSIQQRYNTK